MSHAKPITLTEARDLLPELPAGQGYGDWRALPNIAFEDLFIKCCGHLTETDELRDDFLTAEARLNSALVLDYFSLHCNSVFYCFYFGFFCVVTIYSMSNKSRAKCYSNIDIC